MTSALPRTNFNSPTLIRLLAARSVTDVGEAAPDFARQLAEWLDVADAITLSSVLGPMRGGDGRLANEDAEVDAHATELARLREVLTKTLLRGFAADATEVRNRFPSPRPETKPEDASAYTPFHRFYVALQREMDGAIPPLRGRLRAALGRASPGLRQLAMLDATFEAMLGARERRLLASIPGLLAQRFDSLLSAHRQALAVAGLADDTSGWLQPGGWLATFREEMQAVVLAELDLRLLPVTGLMDAFRKEVNRC